MLLDVYIVIVSYILTVSCDWQFFSSEHAVLRRHALGTVNQFIVLLPTVSFSFCTDFCLLCMFVGGWLFFTTFILVAVCGVFLPFFEWRNHSSWWVLAASFYGGIEGQGSLCMCLCLSEYVSLTDCIDNSSVSCRHYLSTWAPTCKACLP